MRWPTIFRIWGLSYSMRMGYPRTVSLEISYIRSPQKYNAKETICFFSNISVSF